MWLHFNEIFNEGVNDVPGLLHHPSGSGDVARVMIGNPFPYGLIVQLDAARLYEFSGQLDYVNHLVFFLF